MEALGGRARRALVLMAIAAVILVAAAVSYLRPGAATRPAAAPVAGPQPVTDPIGLSFGDARHGAVTLIDRSPYPAGQARPPVAWLTSDGGRTWRRYAAANIVHFDAPLQAVGVASAGPNVFEVTEDGGRTWRSLTLPGGGAGAIGMPTFLDSEHGWWLRDLGSDRSGGTWPVALWRTDDGGRTWERLDASGIPAAGAETGLRFLDPRHGVMAISRPEDGVTSLLATDDGGNTWRTAASFHGSGLGVGEVGGASFHVQGGRVIAVVTWLEGTSSGPIRVIAGQSAAAGPAAPVSSLAGPTSPVSSLVSFSDDGGQTWSRPLLTPFVFRDTGSLPRPTMDERGRLIALDDRTLWSSSDDGITWGSHVAVLPRGLRATDTIVAAAGALYVRATSGTRVTVLRSLDGGAHWTELPLPIPRAPTS